MKVKSNLVKFTTAAALTITGLGAVNAVNSNSTTNHVQAATTKVKINYVPGYGINIWDDYNNPSFTGERVQHGETVDVLSTAIDAKGKTWYQIGEGKWIQARYTVDANKKTKQQAEPDIANSVISSSKQANKVVNAANAVVGKPYAWGGTGPSGFDCSGLAQYVYSKAGLDISRTTYSQVKKGKTVSMKNLKPGDLLFWGSASSPYHVGIYVGDNQYVHAATPAQGVVKDNISSYFYPSVAKRVLN